MIAIILREDDATTAGVPLTIAVGRPNCARTAEIDNREINETMKRVQKMSVARIIVVIIAGSPIITDTTSDLGKSRHHQLSQ